MAFTDTGVATNSPNVVLPPEVSKEIWAKVLPESWVGTAIPHVTLAPGGQTIQMITGEPEAFFVKEGERKPLSKATLGKREWGSHKLVVMQSFTDEFKNDTARLYTELVSRMPKAIGRAADMAFLHGTRVPTGFDNLSTAASLAVTADTMYEQLVAARAAVAAVPDARATTAWFSPTGETMLQLARDKDGRPLFAPAGQSADLSNVFRAAGLAIGVHEHVENAGPPKVIGVVGDWRKARIGVVEDIMFRTYDGPLFGSDNALIHRGAQDNVFTVIIEARMGSLVENVGAFVRLTTA